MTRLRRFRVLRHGRPVYFDSRHTATAAAPHYDGVAQEWVGGGRGWVSL